MRERPKLSKFEADGALAEHVTKRLEAKDSPMTISRELASGVHGLTGSVSHECIYQAVYAHGARGLRKGLHEACIGGGGAARSAYLRVRSPPTRRARWGSST